MGVLPWYANGLATLYAGDCRAVMADLPADSLHAVVTDPPYEMVGGRTGGAGIMGERWDGTGVAFDPATWRQVCRALRPGAYAAVMGGTRTFHRLMVAMEDGGLEVRDSLLLLSWVYGTGQAKHHGSLKPAWEPIVLARRPPQGTLAANHARWGTGYLNTNACRTPHPPGTRRHTGTDRETTRAGEATAEKRYAHHGGTNFAWQPGVRGGHPDGRHPTNLAIVHHPLCQPASCHPDCHAASLDAQKAGASDLFPAFYTPKAPAHERPEFAGVRHSTVKPLALFRWLVRLLTPPAGTVLDPFIGSGTAAEAALLEGRRCTGIDSDQRYQPLQLERIRRAT